MRGDFLKFMTSIKKKKWHSNENDEDSGLFPKKLVEIPS